MFIFRFVKFKKFTFAGSKDIAKCSPSRCLLPYDIVMFLATAILMLLYAHAHIHWNVLRRGAKMII